MPLFEKVPIEEGKATAKGVDPALVEQYTQYINQLGKTELGRLVFGEDEDIRLGRRALLEAAEQSRQYLTVRRKRGENVLEFHRITKQEFDDKKRKNKERGDKVKASRGR